jgi:hypothetical protein
MEKIATELLAITGMQETQLLGTGYQQGDDMAEIGYFLSARSTARPS